MNNEIAFALMFFGAVIALSVVVLAHTWLRVQRIKWHIARESAGLFVDAKDIQKMREAGYDL